MIKIFPETRKHDICSVGNGAYQTNEGRHKMVKGSHGISWFGAALVTGELLKRSKEGQEGAESYADKMARDNYDWRVGCVRRALNIYGPTLDAAQRIKNSFFTDVEDETLAAWLVEAVNSVTSESDTINFVLPSVAVGDLDFVGAQTVFEAQQAEYESDGGDDDESDDDEDDDDDDPSNW